MLDATAQLVGYLVIVATAIGLFAAMVFALAAVSIRAQHALVDSLGGWKTFLEYRDWYHQRDTPQATEKGD